MLDLIHVLAHGLRTYQPVGSLLHIGIELKQYMFLAESLTTIRFTLTVDILILAELLAAEEVQIEMLFVGRSLHIGGVRYDHAQVLIAVTMIVDSNVIERAGIEILMLHIHVESADLSVENPLRYLQLRILLINGIYESIQVLCRMRHGHILEIERYARQQDAEYHYRAHDSEQGNSRGLHG